MSGSFHTEGYSYFNKREKVKQAPQSVYMLSVMEKDKTANNDLRFSA